MAEWRAWVSHIFETAGCGRGSDSQLAKMLALGPKRSGPVFVGNSNLEEGDDE